MTCLIGILSLCICGSIIFKLLFWYSKFMETVCVEFILSLFLNEVVIVALSSDRNIVPSNFFCLWCLCNICFMQFVYKGKERSIFLPLQAIVKNDWFYYWCLQSACIYIIWRNSVLWPTTLCSRCMNFMFPVGIDLVTCLPLSSICTGGTHILNLTRITMPLALLVLRTCHNTLKMGTMISTRVLGHTTYLVNRVSDDSRTTYTDQFSLLKSRQQWR